MEQGLNQLLEAEITHHLGAGRHEPGRRAAGAAERALPPLSDQPGRDDRAQRAPDLAKQLDVQVEAWSERPLEGAFPFLIVDAMQIKVRRQEAVRPTSVLIAVGVGLQTVLQGVI